MGLISWYKQCKRAKPIGSTFTGHWYDPVTEKTWMCGHRYSLFRTHDGDSPESIAIMCYHVTGGALTEFGVECLPERYGEYDERLIRE